MKEIKTFQVGDRVIFNHDGSYNSKKLSMVCTIIGFIRETKYGSVYRIKFDEDPTKVFGDKFCLDSNVKETLEINCHTDYITLLEVCEKASNAVKNIASIL